MIRVFCDFDGTVSADDVGNALFSAYAGPTAGRIVDRYLAGEINARECLTRECEALGDVNQDALLAFVDQFNPDPHFKEFLGFCRSREIPVTILSDGLDFYVERILKKHGLSQVPFFANHAEFVAHERGTRLVPSFPFRDEHCDQCGNCKRNHIATMSEDNDRAVYIGDGISDRCPVRYADLVFAKGSLIGYCQEQNISYYEFGDFGDVQRRMGQIFGKKHIKARREAVMARRDLFIAE
ncbi:MAG: MtnX-like HAD-IB family phosphatase [Ignavibacteriales bacterium]|nr:MtnX-like HAD-IB family phosphatase [Ignavibacteriales bacterium]